VGGDRENPQPSSCLGVFGLNFTTGEKELEREFGKYGEIEKVHVVLDGPSKRSRGFAFIYFKLVDDAEKARDALNGTEISGFTIRVDFSITKTAHKPTPGVYFHHGKATRPGFRVGRGDFRGGRPGRGDYRGRGGRGGGSDRGGHYRDDRDRYYERRPPGYYDRGYDRYDKYRDYYGPPRHRDDYYERDRYYEDRYREDRYREEERYREERRYREPERSYSDRGREYERRDYYERERYYPSSSHHSSHYPSSSSRRSPSPGPAPRRADY